MREKERERAKKAKRTTTLEALVNLLDEQQDADNVDADVDSTPDI